MKHPVLILVAIGIALTVIEAVTPNRSCAGRVCEGPACVAPDFAAAKLAEPAAPQNR